jgi:hypothetical protein
VTWNIVLLDEVDDWFLGLDQASAETVAGAIDMLEDQGPGLPRPLADRVSGSSLHNLKELRPGSAGRTEIRILYIFDPKRNCVLLVAGDKSGQWNDWYRDNIPLAEERYEKWLAGDYADERK